ncbi:hypothetical protein [Hymenobacter qilianensis]|uniref:hypothetical protein n=1 Tax=Hymenobacter qilianensis TaxID=1385715 RepID=UPI00166BC93D|nr:hypothetical protein [Hymenobacter qilianensis]
MLLSSSFLSLLAVLFKTLLVAGGTFYVTFILCSYFPAVGNYFVRLFGFDK